MAEKNAIFGLFTNDKASHVFKDLGIIAKKSAGMTDQLEVAVSKASKRAIAASESQRQAQAKATIAQTKYDEVLAKGNVTESQRLAAQERLTVALNRADVATVEAEASTSALTSAEARATFGAKQLGNAHGFANSKMGSLVKTVTAGASAFAGYEIFKFGKQSVTAAEDFQVSQTKLETSIKNSGHSWAEYAKPIDDVNTKMAALGFKNTETQDALAYMTSALKDPTKALDAMGTAADVARKYTMPLKEAAVLVAKGMQGFTKPLKAIGIDLPVAAAGALKLKNANDGLAKAQATVHDLQVKSHTSGGRTVAQTNAIATAQLRLNGLLYKYNDPMQRTISQTNQINAARLRLSQAEGKSTTSSTALATAQAEVLKWQQKVNDATSAGTDIRKGIDAVVGGSAVAATNDLTVKQDALNASYEEMQRKVGEKLLPDLEKLTDWMIKSGIPDMEKFGHWVSTNKDNIELLGEGLAVFYVGSKFSKGLEAITKLTVGSGLLKVATGAESGLLSKVGIGGTAAAATKLPVVGAVIAGGIGAGLVINRFTKNLDPLKTLVTAAERKNKEVWKNTSMSDAKSKPKALTSASKAPTIIVHNHIAGSVVTEKKLADTIHNHIAANMKRAGVNPKAIGK